MEPLAREQSTAPRPERTSHFVPRFSLKGALLLTAIAALAFTVLVQERRLRHTQASLARYESERIPTSLPAGRFRVIGRTILDTDHAKVLLYRVETTEEHFATVDEGIGGSAGSSSRYDLGTGLHWSEVIVLIDHLSAGDRVKVMAKVGGAGGHTQMAVAEDFSIDEAVDFTEVDGVYSLSDRVELLRWDDKAFTLWLR